MLMDAKHVGMSARWFSLTLVKGDEGVEAGEEGADRALLVIIWAGNFELHDPVLRYVES